MESIKRTATNTPLGELANYSIRSTATPINPTDSSGQIPTFSASVTDLDGDPKALVGSEVTLRDWTGFYFYSDETGQATRGRVTSVSKGASPLTQIDASTIFEKLNTEQTTMPIMQGDTITYPAYEALEHWCLMAGVPRFSVEGNLRHYISSTSSIGYLGDSKYKWRYAGPPTSYRSYITSEGSLGSYAPPLDVNLSQGVTFGMRIEGYQVSEYRVQCFLPHLQQNVIYTVRRNDNVWTLLEKVGSGGTTTLKTWTQAPTQLDPTFFLVKVDANAADATKVDVTFRLLEWNYLTQQTVITDSPLTSPVSTLRNRPKPYIMDLGYDNALIGGKTFGYPSVAFISESSNLQANYPRYQIDISLFTNYPVPADELAKMPDFIPGFTGNVWDKIREFCSIFDLDIFFQRDSILFRSRGSLRNSNGNPYKPARLASKGALTEKMQDRDTARSVEVNYYERVPGSDNFDVMWKADSVYSLEKGETKVEVINTENTFIFLNQPVPVSGVPVPYTSAFGSYVITGNDGYIVDPQWWKDNGGSITVNTTGVQGEIQITMQAPTIDTVRAPYRISEGVADRPALYIVGYGLPLKEPVATKVFTGNPKAAQEVGAKLDSKFVTKPLIAMNAGFRLAAEYGSGEATISYVESRADYAELGDSAMLTSPLNESVYFNGSYYRVVDQTITPNSIQIGEAKTYNTISVLNGEFAETKTIADWNALHDQKTIAQVNVAPLPYYES